MSVRPRWIVASAVVLSAASLVLVGGFASHAALQRQLAPAPTAVAIVDLQRLFNGLTELTDRNKDIDAKQAGYKAELEQLKKQAEDIEKDLSTTVNPSDTKQRTELSLQAVILRQSIQGKSELYTRVLDIMSSDLIRELYGKCTAAVASAAKRDGYDLVLFDDRSISLPERSGTKELNQVVANKRVLYANDTVDITDRLITLMNNDYKAGVKSEPAPAPAPEKTPPAAPAKSKLD
ncbi:MAG: OmpH family outer membrane protein [Phycisphaerales bacterium]|jgi:Skp family chaperone for outer membrane proteins